MIKNNVSMTVKTLKSMRDNPSKDTIDFDSPIQRKSGMWDEKRKSLLIHSILMNSVYSVPTVYFRKDMVAEKKYQYSVIDGIQRITTIFSFIDNEFCLADDVPIVRIDGVEYDVSGKYFSDLEQDCQQEIIRFKLRIEAFEAEEGDTEQYINDTIEEVFSRINSAVPLTSAQLCKAKAGTSIAIILNELLTSKFFTESCAFTKAQLKASDDQRCLLQTMMLLDRNYAPGFELKDFSEKSIMEYSESIKGNYTDKQSSLLRSAVEYLANTFPEKNKHLKKINIPMLLYMADVAQDLEIKPIYFRQWFEYFTEEDALFEDYKTFCSTGSTKLEKVDGRLAVMAKSFADYNETEIPEELTDIVSKAERILEERKTAEQMEREQSEEPANGDELLSEEEDHSSPKEESVNLILTEETVNQTLADDSAEDAETSTSEEESEEDFYASGSLEQSYSEEDSTDSTADSDFEESTDDSE